MPKLASGCLFGMAFGDALGFKTEFLSLSEIVVVGEALLSALKSCAPNAMEEIRRL